MEQLSLYNSLFIESFSCDESLLGEGLVYQSIPAWDSVGHMTLIAEIEEKFNITLEIDDIIDFSSYNKGKEILRKYGLSLD